jgi:hypothetical protein
MVGERHTAELVQEKKGRRALYLRCGQCGGIQTRSPEGQRRIKKMIRDGALTIYSPETAAEVAAYEAEEEAREGTRQARGGWLGWLVHDDESDEDG